MTAIAQKNVQQKTKSRKYNAIIIKHEDPVTWRDSKRSLYIWLKNQCMKHKLKDQIQWVVEIYIANSNLKGASIITNETLLKKYNDKHSNNPISKRTLYRYLAIAQEKKLIKKSEQLCWNSPCKTTILAKKLAVRSVPTCHTNLLLLNKRGYSIAAITPAACAALMPTSKTTEEYTDSMRQLDEFRRLLDKKI